jgi:tetratricopeptide (TPR) repeat protein
MSSNDTMEVMEDASVPRGRREALVLLTLLTIAIAAWAAVGALVNRFHSWQRVLARRMDQRGQLALEAGQPSLAINFFRSSLSFNRDDPAALLNLAESLIAENRLDEAESYLDNLWERQPQDGTTNLELARLATRRRQVTEVLRYYHNAIYGIWRSNPVQNQIAARFELVNFLLQQNAVAQAESELIAMEPGLPANFQLHTKVGQLFLSISDYRSAENEFLQALKLEPNDGIASAGAGKAAFYLGRYRTAIFYLNLAVAKDPDDRQSQEMLESGRLVLEADPFLGNLSRVERQERILKAYRAAANRLQTCVRTNQGNAAPLMPSNQTGAPAPTALERLSARERQLRSEIDPRLWMKSAELPAAAMSFVFEVEDETAEVCGEPSGVDQALLLIGRNREGVER